MPFVRFSRDKRGYEHVYLVHAPIKRGRPAKPRVLYWYRSPPGVRVGREAFDAATRKTLEAQYPDLTFDWDTLAAPPPPVAAIEPWRERRRLRKLQRARLTEADSPESDEIETDLPESASQDADALETDTDLLAHPSEGGSLPDDRESSRDESEIEAVVDAEVESDDEPAATVDVATAAEQPASSVRRSRRRRRGRRRSNRQGNGQPATAQPTDGAQEPLTGAEHASSEPSPDDDGDE
ncbi:MAG: hypothetical protein AB7N65_31780 [Vicinamibacterales bacterium]